MFLVYLYYQLLNLDDIFNTLLRLDSEKNVKNKSEPLLEDDSFQYVLELL